MPRYAVVATVDVADGRMDDLVTQLLAHRDRCRKDEPGTLTIQVLRPNDAEGKLIVFEEYQDEAAFQTHLEGASFAHLVSETAGMFTNVVNTSCYVVD